MIPLGDAFSRRASGNVIVARRSRLETKVIERVSLSQVRGYRGMPTTSNLNPGGDGFLYVLESIEHVFSYGLEPMHAYLAITHFEK
jgi:hypothetical protein